MKLCQVCHQSFPDDQSNCPDHGAQLKHDALVGTSLGGFRISGWLGEGGMGVLYRAEHEVIGRKAAVKVIRGEYLTDERMAGRFEQEARTVARIGHPHLIDIFDIGTTPDGRLYYIMELLEGRSLADRIKAERLDFSTLAGMMVDAMQALEAAHAVKIVHRDLKPDNIFLVERHGEPAFVKVLDFGIAKVLGMDEDVQKKLTKTGSIIGTPQYMAPEQIKGGAIDERADIYALGVILYELCLGRTPFVAETMGALLVAHMLEATPRFSSLADAKPAPGLPEAMEAVCFRALAKEPNDRYPSVRELREDVERVLANETPLAKSWFEAELAKPGSGASAMSTAPGVPAALAGQAASTLTPNVILGPDGLPSLPPTVQQTARVEPRKGRGGLVVGSLVAVVAIGAAGAAVVQWSRPAPAPPPPVVVTRSEPPPAPKKKRGADVPALRSKAIGVISAGLKDGDPVVRKQAADSIVEGHDARHHSMVEPLLVDDDVLVRQAAADALGTLGSQASVPPLRNVFGKVPAVDPNIGESLAHLGDDKDKKSVSERLRKLMKSGEGNDRLQAAFALAGLNDHEACRYLEKVAQAAAADPALALPVLGKLAADGDAKQKDAARTKLAALLDAPDARVAISAARELGKLGDDKAREKLAEWAAKDAFPGRLLAYRILAGLDDFSGYDAFASTFGDSGKPLGERILAAQGLAATGERSALELFTPALEDGSPGVRLAAAGAILAIAASDPRVLAETSLDWANGALADGSATQRVQAILVLADTDSATAIPLLKKALADDDEKVRAAAVKALGKQKSEAATEALATALEDKKSDVRVLAMQSLASVGGEKAAAAVEKHMETAKGEEKVVAAGALMKLGKRGHVDELKEALASKDAKVRALAVEQAAADPEMANDALATALKDKAPNVQLAAALHLAERGNKDGVDVLQRTLAKASKSGGAGASEGLAAYAALAKLGVEPEAKLDPATLLDAKDPKVRARAVDEASRLPEDKAVSFYKRAMRDRDPSIRMAALAALGDLAKGKSERAVVLLRAALKDGDAGVRAQAEALVARYAPKPAPEPEEEAPTPKKAQVTPTSQSATAIAAVDSGAPPDPARPFAPDLAMVPDLARSPEVPDLAIAPQARAVSAPPDLAMARPDLAPELTEADRSEAQNAAALADIALRSGRWNDAIRELNRVRRLDARANVWFELGEAYRNLADHEDDPARRKDGLEKAAAAYKRSNKTSAKSYAAEVEQLMASP